MEKTNTICPHCGGDDTEQVNPLSIYCILLGSLVIVATCGVFFSWVIYKSVSLLGRDTAHFKKILEEQQKALRIERSRLRKSPVDFFKLIRFGKTRDRHLIN